MIAFYKVEIGGDEHSEYFSRYINLASSASFSEQIEENTARINALFSGLSAKQLSYRYAPGKWTLAEVIGHMLDTERIFCYRALRAARNDSTPLPGFEQDGYVTYGNFNKYKKDDLIMEYSAVRLGTATLFEYMGKEELCRKVVVEGNNLSARAAAFIIIGHELHHLSIINQKYLKQ